jgi:hypothetical protein
LIGGSRRVQEGWFQVSGESSHFDKYVSRGDKLGGWISARAFEWEVDWVVQGWQFIVKGMCGGWADDKGYLAARERSQLV